MADISATLVKQLRDITGAGMMECKKALVEASGDVSEAQVILRKRGLASAAKKSGRSAKQGLIYALIEEQGSRAVLIEVNCESDFVARTEQFQALVAELADHVMKAKPVDVEAMLAQPLATDGATKIADYIANKIATIGENILVPRFAYAEAAAGANFGVYIHPGAQLGVLIEVGASKAETFAAAADLIRDLAMQIAAADPRFIRREEVTADVIEKEKDIQKARAMAEGKPAAVAEKIVEGRMGKFYEEICLLEQPFIKDNALSVTQMIAAKGKELGDTMTINRFFRFKVGETAPAETTEE